MVKKGCNPKRVEFRNVNWSKTPLGWMKINVDGSLQGIPAAVGAGGLIRDDRGTWKKGFCVLSWERQLMS